MHCVACDSMLKDTCSVEQDLCSECMEVVNNLVYGPRGEREAVEVFEEVSYDDNVVYDEEVV